MRQVFALEPELRWIKMFRKGHVGISVSEPTRLMESLANVRFEWCREHKRMDGPSSGHACRGRLSGTIEVDGLVAERYIDPWRGPGKPLSAFPPKKASSN